MGSDSRFPGNFCNIIKLIFFLTRNEYNSFDPVQLYLRPMVDQEFPLLFHLSYFHEFDPNIELYAVTSLANRLLAIVIPGSDQCAPLILAHGQG